MLLISVPKIKMSFNWIFVFVFVFPDNIEILGQYCPNICWILVQYWLQILVRYYLLIGPKLVQYWGWANVGAILGQSLLTDIKPILAIYQFLIGKVLVANIVPMLIFYIGPILVQWFSAIIGPTTCQYSPMVTQYRANIDPLVFCIIGPTFHNGNPTSGQ